MFSITQDPNDSKPLMAREPCPERVFQLRLFVQVRSLYADATLR